MQYQPVHSACVTCNSAALLDVLEDWVCSDKGGAGATGTTSATGAQSFSCPSLASCGAAGVCACAAGEQHPHNFFAVYMRTFCSCTLLKSFFSDEQQQQLQLQQMALRQVADVYV